MTNQNDGWGTDPWANKPIQEVKEITLSLPLKNDDDKQIQTIEIEAYQIGDLAIHKAANMNWRITHIPTKTRFDAALPELEEGRRYTKQKLIQWAVKVQTELLGDWERLRTLTPDDYQRLTDSRQRIKDMCQSIEVE